jgi:signal transduction histidine kinase
MVDASFTVMGTTAAVSIPKKQQGSRLRASDSLSLKAAARIALGAALVFSIVACGALVVLVIQTHAVSSELAWAAEDIRSSEELQNALILHYQARTSGLRAFDSAELRQALEEAPDSSAAGDTESYVEQARAAVNRYLSSEATDGDFVQALGAARRLVALSSSHERAARLHAARWDSQAEAIGLGAAATVLLAIGFGLWRSHHHVVRPLLQLDDVMQKFTGGDLNSRANELGVRECRSIALAFNDLADSLVRARFAQLHYVAGVVHDLRSPLSAILLATGFGSGDAPLPSEPRLREIFKIVRRQVDKLNAMVTELLNSVRLEAGDFDLAIEDCDAVGLLREAGETFQAMAPTHALEIHVPPGGAHLRCDRSRIEQVLNNLIGNAIKFSPPGSTVSMEVEQDERAVTFKVVDEGEGVLPQEREKIFEPFRRSATHGNVPGVGLGLYVSKRIVEAHGGVIQLSTSPGRGAAFSIVLPKEPSSFARSMEPATA